MTPTLDENLLQHVKDVVMVLCTDGGPDEVRGMRLLRRDIFTNATHVLDKTHAACRIIEKPQKAEPFLDEVFDYWIYKNDSITNMIEHSPDIKETVARHVSNVVLPVVNPNRVRSLSFCKPRFNSTSKPTGRAILWVEALIAT